MLVPKLQLGNPALEAPASRIKGKPEHFGPSRSENRGRGNVTGCVTKQGQPFPSWSLGTSGTRRCAGSQAPAWEPRPRSSSFKDIGKTKALRTLTERESRARKRDGMRYQAGTAVPKLELGNERSSSRRSQAPAWEPSPRSSSFKDTGKARALRTLTEREYRARKRDGMRYQAGTAVPKLELGNERGLGNERTSGATKTSRTTG